MMAGMVPFPAGVTVGALVDETPGGSGAFLRAYNFDFVMDPANLPRVRSDVEAAIGSAAPESTPVAIPAGSASTAVLSKGGALVGFFPNSNKRYYEITMTTGAEFILRYRDEGSSVWLDDPTLGNIHADTVFKSAKAFILRHWWTGTHMIGDKFTFNADPLAKTIEMPVLFWQPVGAPPGAHAFTIDHVNSLVDGTTVITGEAFGPHVDYDGSGAKDILGAYVRAMFAWAGYTSVITADVRWYHNHEGSLHCATNVRRGLPLAAWWDN